MEEEEGFRCDYEVCDSCGAPAPYRLWFGGELLRRLCDDCERRWRERSAELWFLALEAQQRRGEVRDPIGP
jgi:hypothetical protein